MNFVRRFATATTNTAHLKRARANVGLLGVPLDLGGVARGVEMGPAAFRVALKATSKNVATVNRLAMLQDYGDVVVPKPTMENFDATARHVAEIASATSAVRDSVAKMRDNQLFPVCVGGDHSMAAGSIAGMLHSQSNIGVIWIDAHADFNTPESSPSGNVHGMPLAAACGRGHELLTRGVMNGKFLDESKVVLIGLRDVDQKEKLNLKNSKCTSFTMSDVDVLGMNEVIARAIAIATDGTEGFHCSFDLDSIDPTYAPGVGTPVQGGLTYREAHLAMEEMYASGKMLSLDLVEINPLLDETNKTALMAVELMLSALGNATLD